MKASVVPESGPAVDLNRVVEDEEIEDARSGSENMRNSKTGMKAHLSNPKSYDPNKPRYELYDVLSNKIRVEEWWPAGPKGDAKHFWMCQTCKVQFSFSAVPVK